MVSHSRVKSFLWLLALIAPLLSLLPSSLERSSAAPDTSVPNVQTYSLVEINGQILDASKSPPVPAVLSHTPKPFLPWFRELDTEKFPGPEYENVSAEPATYLTDEVLWSFRAVPTQAPGLTIIHFTWTSPRLGIVGVATFVVINTGPSPEEGSHEIRHLFNGIPLWTLSGPGWQTSLRTFEGISFGGDKTHVGTWSLTQEVNGARTTTPFFVRAMGAENFGITPSPFDPSQGTGMIAADIVGLPLSPDPATWVPEPETTWTLTIKDPVSGGTLWTFTGTSNPIALSFDGIATPEAVAGLPSHAGSHIVAGQPIPPGEYPMRLSAVAPLRRTAIAVDGALAVGGLEVAIHLDPQRVEPLVLKKQTEEGTGDALTSEPDTTIIVKVGVSGPSAAGRRVTLKTGRVAHSGGHVHNGDRNLSVGRFIDTQGNFTLLEASGVTGQSFVATRPAQPNEFVTRYRASAFGGIEKITATVERTEGQAQLKVAVKDQVTINGQTIVQDLRNFQEIESNFWNNTPGSATHPTNLWGRHHTLEEVQLPLLKFFQEYSIILEVNDMSLPSGGGFDISANWAETFHTFHRLGESVDINRQDVGYAELEETKVNKLTGFMHDSNFKRYVENANLHYYYVGEGTRSR